LWAQVPPKWYSDTDYSLAEVYNNNETSADTGTIAQWLLGDAQSGGHSLRPQDQKLKTTFSPIAGALAMNYRRRSSDVINIR